MVKRTICLLLALFLLSATPAFAAVQPPDGQYLIDVTMTGGTGRVTMDSPCHIQVENGLATATVVLSSKNYEYMLVDGQYYYATKGDETSSFEIPIVLDEKMKIAAQTTAMGEPHEIEYVLTFDSATMKADKQDAPQVMYAVIGGTALFLAIGAVVVIRKKNEADMKSARIISLLLCTAFLLGLCGCGETNTPGRTGLGNGTEPVSSMELSYAKEFSADYYEDGCRLLTVSNDNMFLVVPEGVQTPSGISHDIVVLQQPIENIYLVAAAAMSLIESVGGLGQVRLSGTQAEKWYNENVRAAMEQGSVLFAGKYSEPDYELILNSGCSLAIESTMIYHTPEVQEKLESLGIPVFVEHSARETHPLGRTEWIKAYGVLLDKEEEAQRLFDEQVALMNEAMGKEKTGSTVAFFHVSTTGYAVARKSGDYVAKMINLAGGEYIFSDLGNPETATATVALEMETFYATAKDADYIIYNATIAGELQTLDELLVINSLFGNFKAVHNRNVWCTDQNLYQETMALGRMVLEMNQIFTSDDPDSLDLEFFYRLK